MRGRMETSKFLTQEQVNDLETGTLVHIEWSGGNEGEYRIFKNTYGFSYAIYAPDFEQVKSILDGGIGQTASGSLFTLTGVGIDGKQTNVRLADGQN